MPSSACCPGRWAAKEAFIKAWSQAIYGRPPLIDPDGVDFTEIEIRPDRWGRVAPQSHLEARAQEAAYRRLGLGSAP